MQYFEDMRTKYGFSDGEAIPAEARECREVYVRALNAILRRRASAFRVLAYDRPGMHNYCLIIIVPSDVLDGMQFPDARIAYAEDGAILDKAVQSGDEAWQEAVEEANGLHLDQYVFTTAMVLEDRFKDVIEKLKIGLLESTDE